MESRVTDRISHRVVDRLTRLKTLDWRSREMTNRFLTCAVSLAILVLILARCAPTPRVPGEAPPTRPPAIGRANEAALMKQAEDLFAQERFQEAAEIYEHILKSFPESPVENETRYRLAQSYHHLRQPAETVRVLRELVEFDLPKPRRVKILALMAESHLNLEKPFDALRWYLAALEEADDPDLTAELQARIQQVLSENLSDIELREIAFIYRNTYLSGYAKFLLAQRALSEGDIELSRQMLSDLLRFHSHEDFFPEVEAFLKEIEGFVPDEYVLGCILPLSGRGASRFGEPSLNGIELAIHAFEPDYDRLNLRLIIKDSKASPEQAARAVEELVLEEGVLAIVGPLFRATSEAAAKKAEELGVPLISLTTKRDITQEGDFVFRNGISYPLQMRSLVAYAIEILRLHRFAVLYPDDGYGKTLTNLFIDEVYRLGGDVVALESYADRQMDFGLEIKRMAKIRDEKSRGRQDQKHYDPIIEFDAIFIPDQADRVAQIAPQLPYYNIYGVTLLGTNAWNNPGLLEKAGKFIQGAVVVDEFFRGSQSPNIRDFVDRFDKTFSEEPTILAAQAFDAARILVSLLEERPILSREAMREALATVQDFKGVSGFNGFDTTGNPLKTPFLLTIEGNEFVEVSPDLIETVDHQ